MFLEGTLQGGILMIDEIKTLILLKQGVEFLWEMIWRAWKEWCGLEKFESGGIAGEAEV